MFCLCTADSAVRGRTAPDHLNEKNILFKRIILKRKNPTELCCNLDSPRVAQVHDAFTDTRPCCQVSCGSARSYFSLLHPKLSAVFCLSLSTCAKSFTLQRSKREDYISNKLKEQLPDTFSKVIYGNKAQLQIFSFTFPAHFWPRGPVDAFNGHSGLRC